MACYIMIMTAVLLVYIYLGYPLLLCLAARLFPRRHSFDDRFTPSATLVISAYNEEKVIEAKINNALQLDYPADKLTIMVVSDCSTDSTDEIVLKFRDNGVLLVRPDSRRGKTFGLNQAFKQITSDVVIFSDANAMYDPHAVRRLVRHFADAQIGYVVGHARYLETRQTAAGSSENTYWNFELKIKEWESAFSSVVGGDGALYAIRTHLYEPLQEPDINDFVNPLQIVAKGYRGIFDPEAWCSEKPAGHFNKEFSRKVRIANRSLNGLLRVKETCNPLKSGRFAWQITSHKLFRWFSPYILLLNFLAMLAVEPNKSGGSWVMGGAALYGIFALLALAGWWQDKRGRSHTLFYMPYYFALMNVASAIGVLLRIRGKVITTWETVRTDAVARDRMALLLPFLLVSVITATLARFVYVFNYPALLIQGTAYILIGIIFYIYLGYPLVLAGIARLWPARIDRDDRYFPEITLLISAFNEEHVIEAKLNSSLALDYPLERLKIVVVSDGSTDATNQLVRKYAPRGIRLIAFDSNRGKISALNDAMTQISSEIVVFSDANAIYDRNALRKLVRNFNDPSVGVVSGKVMLLNDALSYGTSEKIYYYIEHFIQEKEGATGTLVGADGAMYAIRRELFRPPPADTILDDFVISMNIARQGYRVIHEREAIGFERNLLELNDEFRRKARIISGGFQCLLRNDTIPTSSQPLLLFNFISHKLLRWFSGLLFIPLLALLILSHNTEKVSNLPLSIALYFMLGAAALAVFGQIVPMVRRIIPINILHYVFMLALASLVGLYRQLTGQQKVTWRGGVA